MRTVPTITVRPQALRNDADKYEKFPGVLQLELTNHCNKACFFCVMRDRYNQDEIPLGYMDVDLYKSLIDQCPLDTNLHLNLSMWGESLMHPNFGEMAEYSTSKGIRTVVVTNGLFLYEKREELMSLDDVTISLINTAPLESITKFMEYRKPGNKPFVRMKLYANIPIDFKKHRIPEVDEITMNDGVRIPDSLDTGRMRESKEVCYHVVLMPAITWDGDFLICCMDYRRESIIGNVTKEPMRDLWRVEIYLRDLQRKGFFTIPCNRCRRHDGE